MIKIELNSAGIGELLKSSEIGKVLHDCAEDVKKYCGESYETDTKIMPTRMIASVYTDDAEAIIDNLENNTLLKAVSR